MFWWILLVIAIGVLILSIIFQVKFSDSWWWIGIGLCAFYITFVLPLGIGISLSHKTEIATFKSEKYYIEQVVPTLPDTDNYAITTKRIEENKWLYEMQYRYEHYHFFNFIPAEVMELEEIK